MPLTALDPVAALIVIDLQKGIVAVPTAPHPAAEVVSRSAKLARAFRSHGLPVVLVNVVGAPPGRTDAGPFNFAFPDDWSDLIPELDQQTTDILISKRCVGAFAGTQLDELLHQRGVTQVFLTGISTTAGVESTARSAFDLGYNVVFVTDAMTDRDPAAHAYAVEKVFPRRGETTNAAGVLKFL
jgi:nicotinamidase-related amidase